MAAQQSQLSSCGCFGYAQWYNVAMYSRYIYIYKSWSTRIYKPVAILPFAAPLGTRRRRGPGAVMNMYSCDVINGNRTLLIAPERIILAEPDSLFVQLLPQQLCWSLARRFCARNPRAYYSKTPFRILARVTKVSLLSLPLITCTYWNSICRFIGQYKTQHQHLIQLLKCGQKFTDKPHSFSRFTEQPNSLEQQ